MALELREQMATPHIKEPPISVSASPLFPPWSSDCATLKTEACCLCRTPCKRLLITAVLTLASADRRAIGNAADLAMQNRGTYVEGYASLVEGGGGFPMLHAWVTLDGVHAIDPTWRIAGRHCVGIAFPVEIVERFGLDDAGWRPLMEDDAAIRALLAAKPGV